MVAFFTNFIKIENAIFVNLWISIQSKNVENKSYSWAENTITFLRFQTLLVRMK